MKHCVLQDSCFLVATLDPTDLFHKEAVYIFNKLLENRKDIKIIVPSLVFYETIVTLIKKGGMPPDAIEKKLWNFLYSPLVLNVAMLETSAFKICKRLKDKNLSLLKTQDLMIVNIAMDYEAQILTFDKPMRKRVKEVYSDIYYCSSQGGMEDETGDFLKDLYSKIGWNEINIDEIPF